MSKNIGIVLPDDWVDLIDKHAQASNRTRSQIIRTILKAYLKPEGGKISIGRPTKSNGTI